MWRAWVAWIVWGRFRRLGLCSLGGGHRRGRQSCIADWRAVRLAARMHGQIARRMGPGWGHVASGQTDEELTLAGVENTCRGSEQSAEPTDISRLKVNIDTLFYLI
mgnify:CR=1 FL=1